MDLVTDSKRANKNQQVSCQNKTKAVPLQAKKRKA